MKKPAIVSFIEWCGKHPFATGLMALVGLTGFVLSIFWQTQNSGDTARLQAAVENVQGYEADAEKNAQSLQQSVDEVQRAVLADCQQAPCWTAADALDGRLYQATREMVDRKMPAPVSRDGYGSHYELEQCRLTVHFSEEVVSYYSIALGNGACPFSWSTLFNPDLRLSAASIVTVGDVLGQEYALPYHPPIQVAAGCIDCGNAHEPFVEFGLPGSHAANFYTRYITVDFSGKQEDGEYRARFIDALRRQYPQADYLYIEQYCELDLQDSVMSALRDANVTSVGFGAGWRSDYKADPCNQTASPH